MRSTTDFEERYPGISGTLGIADYILQSIIGFIKLILFLVVLAVAAIVMPIYWFIQGPAERAEVVEFLNKQPERHISTLDFRKASGAAAFLVLDENFQNAEHAIPTEIYGGRTVLLSGAPSRIPMLYDEQIYARYSYAGKYWGSWMNFDFDRMQWIEGKQAPLVAAYYRAAITASELHSTIFERLPKNFPTGIVIPEAPVIAISYVKTIRNMVGYSRESINDSVAVAFHKAPAFALTGMCLSRDCKLTDLEFTNDRDYTEPTVSDRQQKVIDELERMQSDDFWLAAAHRNGVYDRDRDIRYVAQQNRETLAYQFPNRSYFNPFMFFLLWITPAIIFLVVVKRCASRLLKRRRQAVEIEVIPPRQRTTVGSGRQLSD